MNVYSIPFTNQLFNKTLFYKLAVEVNTSIPRREFKVVPVVSVVCLQDSVDGTGS